jgi:predicted metal-dependent hydrolase
VRIRNSRSLDLHVRIGSDQQTGERVFQGWYRHELRTHIMPIIEKWSATLDIPEPAWRIRRMKTKWAICDVEARRIWLNLELIKKPSHCLEYIIAHGLAHFFDRSHSDRFVALMDRLLPQWRLLREELNAEPLAHENWNEITGLD